MSETSLWTTFVLAALATWRITHLLANEDGPADVIVKLRVRMGGGRAGKLMDCFNCLSFWVAAPMALFVTQRLVDVLLAWLALAGAACLLQRVGQEAVVIQPLSPAQEGVGDNGMLRTETGGTPECAVSDRAGRPASASE
jgi:hypothetical protein